MKKDEIDLPQLVLDGIAGRGQYQTIGAAFARRPGVQRINRNFHNDHQSRETKVTSSFSFFILTSHLMRIIAGSAGGVRLKVPSHDVRPTMDMVREAAFSALGELIVDARVLDLFAGSGAYGIEALSRGATEAVFVDNHPKSIDTIRHNLSKTKLSGRVIRQDVFRFLRDQEEAFRIVFADPPYAKKPGVRDYIGELLSCERLAAVVEPGGLLVLERVATAKIQPPPYWKVTRVKRYGTAELLFLTQD